MSIQDSVQQPPIPRLREHYRSLTEETRSVLQAYHVQSKKQLGQHFLIDVEALDSVVRAANVASGNQLLEIGPGIGTLTRALAQTGATIQALELDPAMVRIARDRTVDLPNVTIHEGNVLHSDLQTILNVAQPFSVVANIPYYITAPILRLFLEGAHRPVALVLMIQREVGERLAAAPGEMSALTVFTQVHARVEIVRTVPPTSFMPPPEVSSAIVRLTLWPEPPVPLSEQPYLFRVVKAGFSSKRKMVHNALNQGLPNRGTVIDEALHSAGVDRNRRAETLSISEWRALALALAADPEHQPKQRNDQQ